MVKRKISQTGVELLSSASRALLKATLVSTRGMLTSKGWRPICAVCGEPIIGVDPDMHEAIVTRGNVQGNLLLESLLFVEENCVLVHPGGKNLGTCHLEAHSRVGRQKCIKHILKYISANRVLAWLDSLSKEMKTTFAYEKIAEVNAIWHEMPVDHRHITKIERI